MRRALLSAVLLTLLVMTSAAAAQVIYEPVQYQYSAGGRTYYYGGADPFIHRRAASQSYVSGYGRTNGWAFHSATIDTHREVSTEPQRIFSDAMPTLDARFHGYTADDARNEAYQNATRYFRKADLPRTAVRQQDGSWVVPAQLAPAGSIVIRPYVPVKSDRPMIDDAKPKAEPKPILIIPKRLLDKPLWGPSTPMANAKP